MGGQSQRRMTAIGDAVNFASRVEEANKEFGTRLLISEAAYSEAGGHFVTDGIFEQVVLKGKSGQYRLYEIIGSDGT